LHLSDLGGQESTSEAERSIIRRAATLTVELERLELKFARAGEATTADLDLYQRTSNSLRRLLESVGLQRRMKDVTPTLAEVLARHATEKADSDG
jgi:hypothetical protein